MARRRKDPVESTVDKKETVVEKEVFEQAEPLPKKEEVKTIRVDLLKADVSTKSCTYFTWASIKNMWTRLPLTRRIPCALEQNKFNVKDIFYAQKQRDLFLDESNKILYINLPKKVSSMAPGCSVLPKMFVNSSFEKKMPKKHGDDKEQRMRVITDFNLEEIMFSKDQVTTFPGIKSTV